MIQHLIELRKRLMSSLMSVGIVFLALYPFSSSLFHRFALPLLNQLPHHQELIAITLTGAFFGPIQFCLFCAFFISAPFIFYQLWGFVAPGLYKHEQSFVKVVLIASSVLFYAGVIFSYTLIFPAVMAFLTHVAPEGVLVSPDISSYLHFSLQFLIAFGLAFEIPVFVVLVIKTNLVSKEVLQKKRRYIIVFNFIVGMLLTPDVFSQVMLALPMCLLFELGLLASCWIDKCYTQSNQDPNFL